MTRVALIGSGFVGRAWAISFARAGSEVAPLGRTMKRRARLLRISSSSCRTSKRTSPDEACEILELKGEDKVALLTGE